MRKKEPQIFTRTDMQGMPVDDATLDALDVDMMAETLIRVCIKELLIEQMTATDAQMAYGTEAEEIEIASIDDVETVGDLRKLINHALKTKRKKAGKRGIADTAVDVVVDEIQAMIPGFAIAKNLMMAVKSMYSLDDEEKTGTAFDALNVDDDISKIVDDPVENAFLDDFSKNLSAYDDDYPLTDLNVTELLTQWIAQKFNNTTLKKGG
jgi:hypothetical protein